jgi:predicted nucleic acid-binding protein
VAVYFLDSSALVKRYVKETGTAWMRRLSRRGAPNDIDVASIALVEVTSAIARRKKGGTVLPARAPSMLWRFRKHLAGRYTAIDITPTLLADAAKLATAHALRAYDAVQLAAALTVLAQGKAVGISAITLVSADKCLNDAAQAEGLAVENPNSHP